MPIITVLIINMAVSAVIPPLFPGPVVTSRDKTARPALFNLSSLL